MCCCKDWRGHLRAPKGNSGRARVPRCSHGPNPCGGPQSLRPPAPAHLCRGSRPLTLAGASPNSGTRGGSQGYARSRGAAQRGDPDGRWARGQVRQVHCCIGPGRGGGPRSTAVAGGSQTPPARPAPGTPLRLNRREGAGPFILTRLCHRLGLRGPDSEFSKVAAEPAIRAAFGMQPAWRGPKAERSGQRQLPEVRPP